MENHQRLRKAFARRGIALSYRHGVYEVHDATGQASILLPENLPLEEKAVQQLLAFAAVASPDGKRRVCKACATPDIHPGALVPVGTVVATDPDFVIPAALGTDLGCSVRLLATGVTLERLAVHRTALVARLTHALLEGGRDVPVHTRAFKALFDTGAQAFLDTVDAQGLWARADRERMSQELANTLALDRLAGASRHAPAAYTNDTHACFRDPGLASLGGSNHFAELQVVEEVIDRHEAYRAGLKVGEVAVMIHTGSRNFGFHVGGTWMTAAREQWPADVAHPASGLYGLFGEPAAEYLQAMGTAARYAWLNRVAISEIVRQEIEQLTGSASSRLVVDVPHNIVLQEEGLNIHRKGATPAHEGDFALIPGSMGDSSFLVTGLGNEDWLRSCSHGAGRRVRRQQMRSRREQAATAQGWECITLREERRIEEAPQAYKPVGPVITSQEQAGLIRPVVRLRPWICFKA